MWFRHGNRYPLSQEHRATQQSSFLMVDDIPLSLLYDISSNLLLFRIVGVS